MCKTQVDHCSLDCKRRSSLLHQLINTVSTLYCTVYSVREAIIITMHIAHYMGPYLHQYAQYECILYLILTICVHFISQSLYVIYILQCITLVDHYSLQYNMSLPLQYSI